MRKIVKIVLSIGLLSGMLNAWILDFIDNQSEDFVVLEWYFFDVRSKKYVINFVMDIEPQSKRFISIEYRTARGIPFRFPSCDSGEFSLIQGSVPSFLRLFIDNGGVWDFVEGYCCNKILQKKVFGIWKQAIKMKYNGESRQWDCLPGVMKCMNSPYSRYSIDIRGALIISENKDIDIKFDRNAAVLYKDQGFIITNKEHITEDKKLNLTL